MPPEIPTSEDGYINRPRVHSQPLWRVRLDNRAGRHRALDRMRLALQAYEQRAQCRAALHGWIAARAALSTRT
jgi:hypothetical protein